jgi:hypothetical protein
MNDMNGGCDLPAAANFGVSWWSTPMRRKKNINRVLLRGRTYHAKCRQHFTKLSKIY